MVIFSLHQHIKPNILYLSQPLAIYHMVHTNKIYSIMFMLMMTMMMKYIKLFMYKDSFVLYYE